MSWTPRVILRERRPCIYLWHRLHLVRRHRGCEYAECSCGTRRITVLRFGAIPDTMWLYGDGQLSILGFGHDA